MIDTSKLTYEEEWKVLETLRHFKIEEIDVSDGQIRVILVRDKL